MNTTINNQSKLSKLRPRIALSKSTEAISMPNLVSIQTESYDKFLADGLESVLKSIFPIVSASGLVELSYDHYKLEPAPFSQDECRKRGVTYAYPLRVKLRLTNYEKVSDKEKVVKTVKEQYVFLGDIPIMTESGSFIVNGTERVVVSQLHRSPGLFFEDDKGKSHSSGRILHQARIIPYRGAWLDFEFDIRNLIYARIDRRRKIPATIILKAQGYSQNDILKEFYDSFDIDFKNDGDTTSVIMNISLEKLKGDICPGNIENKDGKLIIEKGRLVTSRHIRLLKDSNVHSISADVESIEGYITSKPVIDPNTGEIFVDANVVLTREIIDNITELGIERISVLYTNDFDCGSYIADTLRVDHCTRQLDALVEIYRVMRPGEPPTQEVAANLFDNLFFNPDRYDLSKVGRMKFNLRLGRKEHEGPGTLEKQDILEALKILVNIRDGKSQIDDIDNLGNRRVRSVGEMLENQFRVGLVRLERIVKDRLGGPDTEEYMPQDYIYSRPVSAAIKEFLGSSQLSQFMDQINPLSTLTHMRRVSALGPGGVSEIEQVLMCVMYTTPTVVDCVLLKLLRGQTLV